MTDLASRLDTPIDVHSGLPVSGPVSPAIAMPANGVGQGYALTATGNLAPMSEALPPLTAAPLAYGSPVMRSAAASPPIKLDPQWIAVILGIIGLFFVGRRKGL